MNDAGDGCKKEHELTFGEKMAKWDAERMGERKAWEPGGKKVPSPEAQKKIDALIPPEKRAELQETLEKVRAAEIKRHAQADRKRAFERSLDRAK